MLNPKDGIRKRSVIMNRSIQERIIFGVFGITFSIIGLYIGYRYLSFVKNIGITFLFLLWEPGHLDSLAATLFCLIIGCLISFLAILVVLNLLSFAYNSLIIAMKGTLPNRDWMIYISLGIIAVKGVLLIPILFGLGSMFYMNYVQWDPHIGDMTYRDNFHIQVKNIQATDKLNPDYECELEAGTGWKFIVLDYYISLINETKPAEMRAYSLVDEKGISYSNYYKDCIPKDEYYYIQEIKGSKFGKLLYRIPLDAVPRSISFHINGTQTPVEISLNERGLL